MSRPLLLVIALTCALVATGCGSTDDDSRSSSSDDTRTTETQPDAGDSQSTPEGKPPSLPPDIEPPGSSDEKGKTSSDKQGDADTPTTALDPDHPENERCPNAERGVTYRNIVVRALSCYEATSYLGTDAAADFGITCQRLTSSKQQVAELCSSPDGRAFSYVYDL